MKRILILALSAGLLTATFSYGNSGDAVQLPERDRILETLKPNHPRLISEERIERIRQAIQEDRVAQKIWREVLTFPDQTLSVEPSVYELRDGRRLLYVSREALDRIRALALVYMITGDKLYVERAWAELEAVANFRHWHPAHFLDLAEMTHAVAIGYDWLYDQWTPEQCSHVAIAATRPSAKNPRHRDPRITIDDPFPWRAAGRVGLRPVAAVGWLRTADVRGSALRGMAAVCR